MYSTYYQAHAVRPTIWFVMGTIRSHDNWAFFRTYDKEKDILEFFVAPSFEEQFVSLLSHLKDEGYLTSFEKKENRLLTEAL